jgi:hypothetical protein
LYIAKEAAMKIRGNILLNLNTERLNIYSGVKKHESELVMKSILMVVLLVFPVAVAAQKNSYKGFPSLIWPKLYDVSYVKETDEHGGFDKPVFSANARSLAGKTVSLPGYMVPFENKSESAIFMLSSLPLNACFFCGVGGPESVIEVHLKQPAKYSEKPVEVRGLLVLNDTDPDKMMYVLKDAEITGAPGF